MSDDPRVEKLLEELLNSRSTPEEVCRDCPELLPEVRSGWRRLRALETEVGEIFPESTANECLRPDAVPKTEPPQIRGYDVVDVLGRGGMGVVYRARHLPLNRVVALKMLLAGSYARAEEAERFLREAEAVAGLKHVNIVQVHDVGDMDGQPYFTMELVDGGSLAQKLSGTPLPAAESVPLMITIAEAVQAAHDSRIVHRDLKPGNILLTSDGVPKITDFGLARSAEGREGLTLSGAAVGTPSYMSPEQARGEKEAIGPGTDVYSLGAILYEMLTGRPPFRGESEAATIQQVLTEEPAPPTRLNPHVPRDLETICLKCLCKEPGRRYSSAADLAEDLIRLTRGEPIFARPAALPERTVKWVRRNPARSALAAAGLVLSCLLIGGGVWVTVQNAHRRSAVTADLKEALGLQERALWVEARAIIDRSEDQGGWSGPADIRPQIAQARRNLDLSIELDAIRLRRLTQGDLPFYRAQSSRKYNEAFRSAGLGSPSDMPGDVAMAINRSTVRMSLVAALDDWIFCVPDRDERAWLLEVAQRTGADPEGWRQRILDPAVWEHPAALADLAANVPAASVPISLLLALAERLRATGVDQSPLLRRVQKEHPADFWANMVLGNALLQKAPHEANGYYRAALAGRPGAAVGYCAVGDALRMQHFLPEAIEYYEMALCRDPGYARAHNELGLAFQAQNRFDEAILSHEKALELDADYAWAHLDLGNAFSQLGRFEEALTHIEQVVPLDPGSIDIFRAKRNVLIRLGRPDDARRFWRGVLDTNPSDFELWFGYPEFSLFLGDEAEYHRVCRILLDRFTTDSNPIVSERLGRACLLVPASQDELREATELIERALASKSPELQWAQPFFQFARGLGDYREGRFEQALAIMKGPSANVLPPMPALVKAMAQHRVGQSALARENLAAAIESFNWNESAALEANHWITHFLRREAETLILADEPASAGKPPS